MGKVVASAINREEERLRGFGGLKQKPLSEWGHQKRISLWLKKEHPHVRFVVSLQGMVHTGSYLGQMIKTLQWHEAGYPDLVIHEAKGSYSLLAIELKKDGVRISKGEHTARQMSWLAYLRKQGAKAEFCIGSEEAMELITKYLNGKA